MIRRIFKVVVVDNDPKFLEQFFMRYGGDGFNNMYGRIIGTDFQILRLHSRVSDFILQFWKFYMSPRFFHLIDILLQGATSLVILYRVKAEKDPPLFMEFLEKFKQAYLNHTLNPPLIYLIGIPELAFETPNEFFSRSPTQIDVDSWNYSYLQQKKQEFEDLLQHPVELKILHDFTTHYIHGVFMELSLHLLIRNFITNPEHYPEIPVVYHENIQKLIRKGYKITHSSVDIQSTPPFHGIVTIQGYDTQNIPIRLSVNQFLVWVIDDEYNLLYNRLKEYHDQLQRLKAHLLEFMTGISPFILIKPKITPQLSLLEVNNLFQDDWEFLHSTAEITIQIKGDQMYTLLIRNQLRTEFEELNQLLLLHSIIHENITSLQQTYNLNVFPSTTTKQFFSHYFSNVIITLNNHPNITIEFPFKEFILYIIKTDYTAIIEKIKQQIWHNYRLTLLASILDSFQIPYSFSDPHHIELQTSTHTYLIDYHRMKAYIKGKTAPLCILPPTHVPPFNLIKIPKFKETVGFETFMIPNEDAFLLSIIFSLIFDEQYADAILLDQIR